MSPAGGGDADAPPRMGSSLESVLEASRDGILVTDGEGRPEFANPASCLFLGRPERQLLGVPLHDIIPESSREGFASFWALLGAGQPSQLTLELTGLDGQQRTLLVSSGILDAGKRPRFFFDLRDMTQSIRIERELRDEKDRAQRYLQIAGVMIVAIGPDQKVLLANRRTCEILGYPEKDVLGSNWFDSFLPERERERVRTGFVALMRGALDTAEYFENPVRTHDGSERLIAWHNKLVYDDAGNIIGTISSGTDITERKKAERELMELNETLEQRVVERTAVAEQQAKKLRSLTRELIQAELQERRRVAMLLHEHFQQLLVAARMNLNQVLQHADAPNLRDLLKSTDEILYDAVESSRTLAVELCPPLLYELGLVPALEWLGRKMYERHALEVQIDADLDREPEDLDLRSFCFEAVRELLFNVVKHAGVLAARVTLRRENHFLEIRVSDKGKGFDPQQVQPLRTDSLDFGLFAIRERLSSLGGRIELASAPGEGTQVTLFAPLQLESR